MGGLTTVEVARAFLVPEATMAQRISRAKQRVRDAGSRFALPPEPERAERLRVVLHVLYLIFNEGYTASAGQRLHRGELTREAIRLTRTLHALLPDDGEIAGLLALMLLTDARDDPPGPGPTARWCPSPSRTGSGGTRASIAEGVALVTDALSRTRLGPYQLQAAIATIHDESPSRRGDGLGAGAALYELLERTSPSPMVTLNRAVAMAMVRGPAAGLDLLVVLENDDRMARHHRLHAVRAHLLEHRG